MIESPSFNLIHKNDHIYGVAEGPNRRSSIGESVRPQPSEFGVSGYGATLALATGAASAAMPAAHSATSKLVWMYASLFGNTQLITRPSTSSNVNTVAEYVSASRFVTVSVPITVQMSLPGCAQGVSSAVGRRSTNATAAAAPNANGPRKRRTGTKQQGPQPSGP